jgi:hypothetical protein
MTEGETLNVHITSTDPDSTRPALSVSGLIPAMIFTDSTNGNGSLIFRSLFYHSGVYNLMFRASDGQAADSEQVTITVIEAGNQLPELAYISDKTVLEGSTLRFGVVATDPDSTLPRLEAHNIPANAAFVDSGNGRGGFTFSPNYSQSGNYQVTFVAFDRENPGVADSQAVLITVTDYNRWPTIDPIGPQTVNEGDSLFLTVVAHDPDGTIPWLAAPYILPNAVFTDNGDGTGSFAFRPSYFQAGVDSVRFMAVDAVDPGLYASLSIRITIVNVNRAPIMTPVPDTTAPESFLFILNVNAVDPDSTIPIMFVRGRPDSATFVDNNDGSATFRWRPRFQDIGVYNVIFGCRDRQNQALADSDFVVIQVVSAGNHAPLFVQLPDQQLGDGDTLDLNVTANDLDGDLMTITHVGNLPFGMTLSETGNGHAVIHWIPLTEQEGDTSITLVVTDTGDLTDTMGINFTVVTYIRGDANNNGVLNGLDVVFLVNYLKGLGPRPDPYLAADANGNGEVNGLDVIYLVNYFKGGPPPPPAPGGGGAPFLRARQILPRSTSGAGN